MTKQEIINILNGGFSEDTKMKMITKIVDSNNFKCLKEVIIDPIYGSKIINYLKIIQINNRNAKAQRNKQTSECNIEDVINSKDAFIFYFGECGLELENFIIHIDNDINEVLNTSLEVAKSREYTYSFLKIKEIDESIRKISLIFSTDELNLHKRILKFYEGKFEKSQNEKNGKFTRGYWKDSKLDINEFYEKFINIQSIREYKFSNILD